MEAEHKQIFEAITSLDKRFAVSEALQEERHKENQKDINAIGGLTRSLEKHCVEITKLKVHRATQWFFIGGIIVCILGVAIRTW